MYDRERDGRSVATRDTLLHSVATHVSTTLPDINGTTIIGGVIRGLEVVQHGLGVGENKPTLLPLPRFHWDGTPATPLPYAFFQVPSLEVIGVEITLGYFATGSTAGFGFVVFIICL